MSSGCARSISAVSWPRRQRPLERGAGWEVITATEQGFEDLRPRCGDSKFSGAWTKKRRSERHVLRPTDRAIGARRIAQRFANHDDSITQLEAPLEFETSDGKLRACDDFVRVNGHLVGRDRSFAMRGQSVFRFFFGWWTKDIEAEVVPHDSGEQRTVRSTAVCRRVVRTIRRRLDRWPWRRPQRIHARRLVEDFSDVTTVLQHGHSDLRALDRCRAAATIMVCPQSLSFQHACEFVVRSDTSNTPCRPRCLPCAQPLRTQSTQARGSSASNRAGCRVRS